MIVEVISFDEILPTWTNELWPGRTSRIEELSAINSDGQIEMDVIAYGKDHPPCFWRLINEDGVLCGVVAAQPTAPHQIRLRGIWVNETLRRQGTGRFLIQVVRDWAINQKAEFIWIMARESRIDFYDRCGFVEVSRLDRYEFGPHILMRMNI